MVYPSRLGRFGVSYGTMFFASTHTRCGNKRTAIIPTKARPIINFSILVLLLLKFGSRAVFCGSVIDVAS